MKTFFIFLFGAFLGASCSHPSSYTSPTEASAEASQREEDSRKIDHIQRDLRDMREKLGLGMS
jgi:hypothetical protein